MSMTAARLKELEHGAQPTSPEEAAEFEKLLAWRRRSNAAKRAVLTKRVRYTCWPTRARTHHTR